MKKSEHSSLWIILSLAYTAWQGEQVLPINSTCR
jgi:hypothetical protein